MPWGVSRSFRRFSAGLARDEPRLARTARRREGNVSAPGRPKGRRQLEALELESDSGSLRLDGARPILADFLAMGAGRAAVPGVASPATSAVVEKQLATHHAAAKSIRKTTHLQPDASSIVRERRLVAAALQRTEALAQPTSETPSRAAVGEVAHRSVERVPLLFAQSYVGYVDKERREADTGVATGDDGAQTPGVAQKPRASLANMRLQVLPWHRRALRVTLCRALVYHFLHHCRDFLGLSSNQPPLFLWEARRAQDHSTAGDVVPLVKYLAETELHIKFGPERSTSSPSDAMSESVAQRLRAERRQPAKQWGLQSRDLHEDAIMRTFLDGVLSWPRVRDLLDEAPLTPRFENPTAAEPTSDRLW